MQVVGQTIEHYAGRWTWEIAEMDDAISLSRKYWSPVSFESDEDANRDMSEHLAATLDETGRRIRTKDQIQELIRMAAQACPDCDGVYFGGVYRHARDRDGCNWGISTMAGIDWATCYACVNEAAIEIRRAYSVPEDD